MFHRGQSWLSHLLSNAYGRESSSTPKLQLKSRRMVPSQPRLDVDKLKDEKLINLMSELYSGTESAVRYGYTISDLFPVVTGVCQRCVLASTLFSTCTDWILGRMSERSSCGASFGNVKISDLDFADDAVIFAEILDILLGALEVLNEESEPLGCGFPGSKLRSRLSMTS